MMKLKFDHEYSKIPEDVSKTCLLEVIKTHYNDLHAAFKVYDTEHDSGYYQLPKTDLLLLILISYEKNVSGGYNELVWTALRRHTESKEKYYISEIGNEIEFVIDDGIACDAVLCEDGPCECKSCTVYD